jgi:hypothetical protein
MQTYSSSLLLHFHTIQENSPLKFLSGLYVKLSSTHIDKYFKVASYQTKDLKLLK